ncbi:MAG: ATP-binding cassette domain-containing protein [Spirochaetales bacterium]|nr:ATP-binding cassette domain-containing protein [Spirochaetales bacterium]
MLKAENIAFKYNRVSPFILKDLSLAISPGEVIGLMGKSGCGKTTFAKILSGYLIPQRGKVSVNSIPLPKRGYCPVQFISQHPEKVVNPGWKIKKILSEVDGLKPDQKILDLLHINSEFLERYPHELSGGELQRITLYRILNSRTKYIIADEISGMLDTITQANIWNALVTFASRHNIGMLVISHDKGLLERLCTRIIEDLFK